MKLETLYKRAKSGKIQYWQIEVVEASPANYGWGIVKTSGQLGTENPIVHRETITKGKNIGKSNETTPQQQAESQALSDWNKKRDEGYKSLEDLGYLGVKRAEEDLPQLLEQLLPQFNTDASGNPKPMLATDWNKVKSIPYPVLVQPKLDGVRCLIIVATAGVTKSIRFLSRSGKDYNFPHLLGVVFPEGQYILDGEIYSDELTFQEIVAATKKVTENTGKLHFRCYDMIGVAEQAERLHYVSELIKKINSPHFHSVPTARATSKDEVKALHDAYVQDGYEGAMIRFLNGKYASGTRSRELLKVKEFDETEFYFQKWEKGLRDEDLIAVCLTSIHEDAKEFRAKMVGTVAEKKEMESSNIKVDSLITVKHFGWTDEEKIPRFPIGKAFRDE